MSDATTTATTEQLAAAAELLAMFAEGCRQNRGTESEFAAAKADLSAAVASKDPDYLSDAIYLGQFVFGLRCCTCGEFLEVPADEGYCSRQCYRNGSDGGGSF